MVVAHLSGFGSVEGCGDEDDGEDRDAGDEEPEADRNKKTSPRSSRTRTGNAAPRQSRTANATSPGETHPGQPWSGLGTARTPGAGPSGSGIGVRSMIARPLGWRAAHRP